MSIISGMRDDPRDIKKAKDKKETEKRREMEKKKEKEEKKKGEHKEKGQGKEMKMEKEKEHEPKIKDKGLALYGLQLANNLHQSLPSPQFTAITCVPFRQECTRLWPPFLLCTGCLQAMCAQCGEPRCGEHKF